MEVIEQCQLLVIKGTDKKAVTNRHLWLNVKINNCVKS